MLRNKEAGKTLQAAGAVGSPALREVETPASILSLPRGSSSIIASLIFSGVVSAHRTPTDPVTTGTISGHCSGPWGAQSPPLDARKVETKVQPFPRRGSSPSQTLCREAGGVSGGESTMRRPPLQQRERFLNHRPTPWKRKSACRESAV